MTSIPTLFEVSFEVCNKVGGIHTVLSTKARTLTATYGDEYVCLGPWLLGDPGRRVPFEEEAGFEDFAEGCRALGVPVRVGRWAIPSRPRTVLIEFSGLYDQKDDVLAELWEHYQVDSIEGGWDYVEPVLFGHAAGRVIEHWNETFLAPAHRRGVAQFHEWMTGAGLLYLRERVPNIGTVFTTHATMLGRALSSLGHSPESGLGDGTPDSLAREHKVVAKHSLEGVCARQADVFTTVSEITAREAELLHERVPAPVLPNGIDLSVVDELAGPTPREAVRARVLEVAGRFLGEDVSDAALVATSGRYEFHNKGFDVVLDSAAQLEGEPGRRVVLLLLVPAGNSGVKGGLLEREGKTPAECQGCVGGIATHNLFDEEHDAIHVRCHELGLVNAPGSRVKVVHVPIYLDPGDGFWDEPYESVLRAMDLTTFPSYYEPWGYTPQESLALGVPSVTSDFAGFGRWARSQGLGPEQGVDVLTRVARPYDEVVQAHTSVLERFLAEGPRDGAFAATCREAAGRTAWSELIVNYRTAFDSALAAVQARLEAGVPLARRPRRALAIQAASDAARPRVATFQVAGALPAPLAGLKTLSRNFAWCWDREARSLFADLDPDGWSAARNNPVVFLRRVAPEALARRAEDGDYVARVEAAEARLKDYLADSGKGRFDALISAEHPVAYFSAEFGIHESLRIYSGGLGVLAGDHLKSASDLGLPLVAVGLFYSKGYVAQRLTSDGEQLVVDLDNDSRDLPLDQVKDEKGERLELRLALPSRELALHVWQVAVGRVTLYLLDTDVPSNRTEDRAITRNLYGGDETMRIQQEIVLGRGGVRLLRKLGIEPSAWHLNEGHAAFLCLQRVAYLVREEGLTFDEAREVVRASTAFTTHTPVPAGHDRFNEDLVRRYFSDAPEWVGVPWERFMALGRPPGAEGDFNMTHLALSFAGYVNGVSKLHGIASRALLHPAWPALLEDEVPVDSITNGIHLATWTAPEVAALVDGGARVDGEAFARRAADIDPARLWEARRVARERLLGLVALRLERSFVQRDDSPLLLHTMLDGLDPNALLIGFARRFAPYKRAHLLFSDRERLLALLASDERPVRVIVAGKAHPRDQLGKDVLREIASIAREEEFAGRVLFVEDYDIELGRALVQGVDVWLNNPTRMLEASGTSGMKAAANGVLNLSIADGWWPEAADGKNGWTIGGGRVYEDQALQDQYDGAVLYRLLEEEVVPRFFDRDAGGLPQAWLESMKHDLATVPPVFNTDRMVSEYAARAYEPLARRWNEFRADRRALARALAAERQRLTRGFEEIRIAEAEVGDLTELRVGEPIQVRVVLELGPLSADDVAVELVLGRAGKERSLVEPEAVALARVGSGASGKVVYEGERTLERAGEYAYGVRVRARTKMQDAGPGHALSNLVRWV